MSYIFQPIRLLHYLALICLQTTLIHLVGTLLTSFSDEVLIRWPALFAVVTVAVLAAARVERVDLQRPRVRPLTAGLAAVTIIGASWMQMQSAKTHVDLGALFSLEIGETLRIYIVVAASMWAWWQGARLIDLGHNEVVRHLRRGVVILAVLLALAGVIGFEPGRLPGPGHVEVNIATEIIAYFVLGFVSLSSTQIVVAQSEGAAGSAWRRLSSGVVSTLAIMLVGLLLLAIVAAPAREVLRTVALVALYGFAAVLTPLFWLVFQIIALVRAVLATHGYLKPPPPPTPMPSQHGQLQPPPWETIAPLLVTSKIFLLLTPLVVLALLILFTTRRRGHRDEAATEERESIFSWSALGSDLRDLLRGLRQPADGEGGLRAALGRLMGSDPATRIRRRYVQLLLIGEDGGVPRPQGRTPREFAPELANLPLDDTAVERLTELYEQARYAPEDVDVEAASQADASWETLSESHTPPAERSRAKR